MPGPDDAALAAFGERVARYRLARNLTQTALANDAGVSKRTLIRLERGESTQLTNLVRILRALGLAANLDALVPSTEESPMAALAARPKDRSRERRRASPPATKRAKPETTPKPPKRWTWGDETRGDA